MVGRLAVVSILVAALAGCSGTPPPSDAAAVPSCDDVKDCLTEGGLVVGPETRAGAPRWQRGDWWQLQTSFASGDGVLFKAINVGIGASLLATDHPDLAKQDAAFGHAFLGPIDADLGMDGFGGDWDVMDFPLVNGGSWIATIPNIAWDVIDADTVELTMTATFAANLPAGKGTAPGFTLMGMTAAGQHLLEAEYVPAVGWFTRFDLFDVDVGEEGLEVGWRLMDYGHNYTGTYLQHEAELLLNLYDAAGLDGPPPEGNPFVSPGPAGQFTITDAATTLYAILQAEAVVGARAIVLVPPGNGAPREFHTQGDLEGQGAAWFIDEPAVPGQWQVATTGAGGYSAGYVTVFELVEGTFTL